MRDKKTSLINYHASGHPNLQEKLLKKIQQMREQPRTIQKGRAKGYKSREAGER